MLHGSVADERRLRALFAIYHIRGEWFRFNETIRIAMAQAAAYFQRRPRGPTGTGVQTLLGLTLYKPMTYTLNGAQGRNRTTDTAIFSRMLYQLSYLGVPGPSGPRLGGL